MAQDFVFHRPELASRMASIALGTDPLGGSSGLFLAAPRRTGKSTFLKVDLLPELEKRGALPVYVDLWADRARDPGDIIADAIKTAIQNLDSGLVKAMRRSGVSRAGLGSWLAADIDKIGKHGGATLTDAIAHLVARSGRPVVLIVDEAQHAITSAAGANAMFALKSARDTLNIGAKRSDAANVQLGLVFTGSHRDKLASLVIGKDQSFFGSSVTDFPLLGRDFTDAYAKFVNGVLATDHQLDPQEVFETFRTVAFRPQLLQAAIKDYSLGLIGEPGAAKSLGNRAMAARESYWAEFDSLWSGMTQLQRAVLRRIIEQGASYKPFDGESLAAYSRYAGQTVTTPDAQSALEVLREKGLVVRLERGRYSLEDDTLVEWLESRFPSRPAGN